MKLHLALAVILFFITASFGWSKDKYGFKIGSISGVTRFEDKSFASIAKVVDIKNKSFICNAVIISKNQVLTAPKCMFTENGIKRTHEEVLVIFKELNQKETVERTIAEIHIPDKWTETDRSPENNVAILITHEVIPFELFIYTTCLRDFVMKKEKIYQITDTNAFKTLRKPEAKRMIAEIPFPDGSGALYVNHNHQWFIYGLFSASVIKSKVCEKKNLRSLSDVYKYMKCENRSETTAIGTKARESFCSGELIFDESFDSLDTSKWRHENTLAGGGNWEFQWYVPDSENSFVENGILHIKPTLTANRFGESYLTKSIARIPVNECTRPDFWGCERNGIHKMLNPIRSACLSTINSFAFKYGTVEVRAKVSAGDWLASTITLHPKTSIYGEWPESGEIDMAQVRGNRDYRRGSQNIGVETVASTYHVKFETFNTERNNSEGFHSEFHVYKLRWTKESLTIFIDDEIVHQLIGDDALWGKSHDESSKAKSAWENASKLAPFDQEFFFMMSLKAGGVSFFPDEPEAVNKPNEKPWKNWSQNSAREFWFGKSLWYKTWKEEENDFQVDYVRIYAL